ncbi:hypothetical protein CYY_002358 [Polysphondylium violaceum]|uniref:CorA family magnesium ion transporterr n=1 Tax=Polysphondylium violaceum TaxID=133409 RepID=A0A8J4V700_9MYCE|nr:hypothetical protein CYY_002358 [Polysphondylium violaceum]
MDKQPLLSDLHSYRTTPSFFNDHNQGANKHTILIISEVNDILNAYSFKELIALIRSIKLGDKLPKQKVNVDDNQEYFIIQSIPTTGSGANIEDIDSGGSDTDGNFSSGTDDSDTDDEDGKNSGAGAGHSTNSILHSKLTSTTTTTTTTANNISRRRKRHHDHTRRYMDEHHSIRLDKSSKNRVNSMLEISNLQHSSLWIDVMGLSREEIEYLGRELGLHHLTIEDIISADTSEKCEEYPNYIFIATSELQYSTNNDLKENGFYIVVFNEYVIVIHEKPLESFDDVLNTFRYLPDKRIPSSEWLLCSYFDAINEIFNKDTDQLFKEVTVLDDFCLKDEIEYSELYVRLGRATRRSTNLLSNLFMKFDILSSLLRQDFSKETLIYLNSINDRAIRLKQKIKLCEELLGNIHNVYISKVSLLLNEESHDLNISMSRFGTVSIIFMPLTLVAGIFGMNCKVLGFVDEYDSYGPFFIILASMLALAIATYFIFRKLDWIQ